MWQSALILKLFKLGKNVIIYSCFSKNMYLYVPSIKNKDIKDILHDSFTDLFAISSGKVNRIKGTSYIESILYKHPGKLIFKTVNSITFSFKALDVGLCCNTPGKVIFFGGLYFSIIFTGISSIYENPTEIIV